MIFSVLVDLMVNITLALYLYEFYACACFVCLITVPEVDDRPYSKLHGHATLPSTVVNPDHKKSNEEIYSSLFDHTEAIDPIASIEERRRQTQRRKNKERIVVEQHYIVCGGIGVRYHSRWAGKDRMTSDEGGQLLVWELHHD